MILTSWETVPLSAVARFWKYVDLTSAEPCWVWTGALAKGYGPFQLAGTTTVRAHRLAYVMRYGSVDPTLTIDHLCKNRACVYWRHLEVERGENARRGLALTTTCKAGLHLWVEANIVRRPSRPATSGECRACMNERRRQKGWK